MQPYTLPPKAQCYMTNTCTAPPSPVTLSLKEKGNGWTGDFTPGGNNVELSLCGKHARESMSWGFVMQAPFRSIRITKRVTEDTRAIAAGIPLVFGNKANWTEIQAAPREWDSHSCKIIALRMGENSYSFALLHSRTYGCPLG